MLPKRALRLALKRSLGSFVKKDISVDQIDLEITSGTLLLKDLELDVFAINQLLGDSHLHLYQGSVREISISVPWTNFFSENCKFQLRGLSLTLGPRDGLSSQDGENLSNTMLKASSIIFGPESYLNNALHDESGFAGPSDVDVQGDFKGQQLLSELIETLGLRTEATLIDTKLRLEYFSKSRQRPEALEINIPSVQAVNLPIEKLTEEHLPCADRAKNGKVLTKRFNFEGFDVELVEDIRKEKDKEIKNVDRDDLKVLSGSDGYLIGSCVLDNGSEKVKDPRLSFFLKTIEGIISPPQIKSLEELANFLTSFPKKEPENIIINTPPSQHSPPSLNANHTDTSEQPPSQPEPIYLSATSLSLSSSSSSDVESPRSRQDTFNINTAQFQQEYQRQDEEDEEDEVEFKDFEQDSEANKSEPEDDESFHDFDEYPSLTDSRFDSPPSPQNEEDKDKGNTRDEEEEEEEGRMPDEMGSRSSSPQLKREVVPIQPGAENNNLFLSIRIEEVSISLVADIEDRTALRAYRTKKLKADHFTLETSSFLFQASFLKDDPTTANNNTGSSNNHDQLAFFLGPVHLTDFFMVHPTTNFLDDDFFFPHYQPPIPMYTHGDYQRKVVAVVKLPNEEGSPPASPSSRGEPFNPAVSGLITLANNCQDIDMRFHELLLRVDPDTSLRLSKLMESFDTTHTKDHPQTSTTRTNDADKGDGWWNEMKLSGFIENILQKNEKTDKNDSVSSTQISVEGRLGSLYFFFPDGKKENERRYREELLLVNLYSPAFKTCLFSDFVDPVKLFVEFDSLTASFLTSQDDYTPQRAIFEAQMRNTQNEMVTPLEITIRQKQSSDMPLAIPNARILNAFDDYDPSSGNIHVQPLRLSPFSSFISSFEGHKHPISSSEEDAINFRHQAIENSRVSVSLIFPSSILDLEREDWILMNDLLNSVSPPEPQNHQEEHPPQNKSQTQNSSGQSDLTLHVFFAQGRWVIRENNDIDNDPKSYELEFKKIRVFRVNGHMGETTNYTIVHGDDFQLLESSPQSKGAVSLIHKSPFHKDSSTVLSATIQENFPNRLVTSLFQNLEGELQEQGWLSRLARFFKTETEEPSIWTQSEIYLDFHAITLKHASIEQNSSLALTMDTLELSTVVLQNSESVRVKALGQNLNLLLNNDGTPAVYRHTKKLTLAAYWESLGYVPVATLKFIEAAAQFTEEATQNRNVENVEPKLKVELINPTLHIHVCRDSFHLLIQVFKSISNSEDSSTEEPQTNLNENIPRDDADYYNNNDIEVDDEQLVQNLELPTIEGLLKTSQLNSSIPEEGFITWDLRNEPENRNEDPQNAMSSGARGTWLIGEKDMGYRNLTELLMEDYPPHLNEQNFFVIPKEYPPSAFRLVFKEATFHVYLHDGLDFKPEENTTSETPDSPLQFQDENNPETYPEFDILRSTFISPVSLNFEKGASGGGNQPIKKKKKKSEKRSKSERKESVFLCLELVKVNLQMDLFPDLRENVKRLRLTVADVQVVDSLPTSTWKKFFCFDADFPRDSSTDMLSLSYEVFRPDLNLFNSLQVVFKLSLLPVRFNADQDAVELLFLFVDHFLNPPKRIGQRSITRPSTSNPHEPFIRTCEIDPIRIHIDYKPKRVNYTGLATGSYLEILNLFPLEGAVLKLRHVLLSDVRGLESLGTNIVSCWLPHIKSNQVYGMVSGVQPLRPLINVGSGVADLILLPIEQYKRDGRLITGVQRGTSSFVKTLTKEALHVGSRLAAHTQVLLESVDGLFQSPSSALRVSKYADQPATTSEGIQTAYASVSRELRNTMNTVIAVPVEEFHKSGTTGAVRSVIRAVPVAVLRPMIGITEGVTKALMGVHNEMDASHTLARLDKYKTTTKK